MIARLRWRRLLQFRLRTWLLLTVPGLALFGAWWQPAIEQQQAVEELKQLNVRVYYAHDPGSPLRFSSIQKGTAWWPPAWLVNRLGEDFFFSVVAVEQWEMSLSRSTDGDAVLAACGRLRDLRELRLLNAKVTDEGVAQLKSLRRLELLEIYHPQQRFDSLTDEGMAALTHMHSLRCLVIGPAELTDRTLEVVARLPKLQQLQLLSYGFTDAGLAQLAERTQLTSLALFGEFSGPAVAELRTLKRLDSLTLSRVLFEEGEFQPVLQLPALKSLRINGANLSNLLGSDQVTIRQE